MHRYVSPRGRASRSSQPRPASWRTYWVLTGGFCRGRATRPAVAQRRRAYARSSGSTFSRSRLRLPAGRFFHADAGPVELPSTASCTSRSGTGFRRQFDQFPDRASHLLLGRAGFVADERYEPDGLERLVTRLAIVASDERESLIASVGRNDEPPVRR